MGAQNWPELYADYLKSRRWADRREKVLRRAQFRCEGCGDQPATEVHHLTYEHVTQEFLFELIALCRGCHERLHEQSDRPPAPKWTPKHRNAAPPPKGETPTGKAMRMQLTDLAAQARAKLMATPAPADALAPEHVEEPMGDEHAEEAA